MTKLTPAQKAFYAKFEDGQEHFCGRYRERNHAEALVAAGLLVVTRNGHFKKA